MDSCPRYSSLALFADHERGLMSVARLGCKMWDCPYCSEKRRGFLARKAFHGIETYKADGQEDWYFATLTMRGHLRDLDGGIYCLRKNWRRFYERIKRRTDDLHYCLLPEQHEDGSLHVHLVWTAPITNHDMHDLGYKSGFGFKNENDNLKDSRKGAWYVTKYIGKSLGVDHWPKEFNRYRFSWHWPTPPSVMDDMDVETVTVGGPDKIDPELRHLRNLGYQFVDFRTGEIKWHTSREHGDFLQEMTMKAKSMQLNPPTAPTAITASSKS